MKKRLRYLDFIRALSTFFIIIFHFNCSIYPHQVYEGNKDIVFSYYVNGNLGQIGVSLFFIISGVSLMYTWGEKKFKIKSYFIKRWLGIFPMFYLAWVIGELFYFYRYYSLNPFLVERENWTIIFTLLGMDGYLSGVFPNYYILGEWFLGCIIVLYILFPLLLWLDRKIGIKRLLFLSIILYLGTVRFYNFKGIQIDQFFVTRIVDFVFGMFIAEKVKAIKWYEALPALAIVIVFLNWYIDINQMYKITIFGISLFLILMYIGQFIGEKCSFVFEWISKYSYAVFLVHHIVLDQICTHFDGRYYGIIETYVVLIISIVVIFVCAVLLNKLNDQLRRLLMMRP